MLCFAALPVLCLGCHHIGIRKPCEGPRFQLAYFGVKVQKAPMQTLRQPSASAEHCFTQPQLTPINVCESSPRHTGSEACITMLTKKEHNELQSGPDMQIQL